MNGSSAWAALITSLTTLVDGPTDYLSNSPEYEAANLRFGACCGALPFMKPMTPAAWEILILEAKVSRDVRSSAYIWNTTCS
jgi:hypothetical protein